MSSPLSKASSRWLIISLCRKSSNGIVVLLPVLVVSGLYESPDAFQGDFVSALEQTTSFIGSLHLGRPRLCSAWKRQRTVSGSGARTEIPLWPAGGPGGQRRTLRRTPSRPHGATPQCTVPHPAPRE